MHKILSILFIILAHQTCFAWSDTLWLDQSWKKCEQENARYYSITVKEDSAWHRQLFYANSRKLYMDGNYTDPGCYIKQGLFRSYNMNGIITDSVIYNQGVPIYMSILHENGKIKTVLTRNQDYTATYVNSWDKYGNETYLDTFYHDNKGRDCHKDTAYLKGIINKEEDAWRLRFYLTDNGQLYTVGYFKERLCKTRMKYGAWYQNDQIRDSILFNNAGKKREAWYFFNNGFKNAWQVFDTTGKITAARNWDEQGNEINADTSSVHAMPIERYKDWEKKLMKKMNNDNSIDWKTRKDYYSSVSIRFFINEDGSIKTVTVKDASLYPAMDSLILNACKESLLWKPCSTHGRRRTCTRVKWFSYVAGVVLKAKDMYY